MGRSGVAAPVAESGQIRRDPGCDQTGVVTARRRSDVAKQIGDLAVSRRSHPAEGGARRHKAVQQRRSLLDERRLAGVVKVNAPYPQ